MHKEEEEQFQDKINRMRKDMTSDNNILYKGGQINVNSQAIVLKYKINNNKYADIININDNSISQISQTAINHEQTKLPNLHPNKLTQSSILPKLKPSLNSNIQISSSYHLTKSINNPQSLQLSQQYNSNSYRKRKQIKVSEYSKRLKGVGFGTHNKAVSFGEIDEQVMKGNVNVNKVKKNNRKSQTVDVHNVNTVDLYNVNTVDVHNVNTNNKMNNSNVNGNIPHQHPIQQFRLVPFTTYSKQQLQQYITKKHSSVFPAQQKNISKIDNKNNKHKQKPTASNNLSLSLSLQNKQKQLQQKLNSLSTLKVQKIFNDCMIRYYQMKKQNAMKKIKNVIGVDMREEMLMDMGQVNQQQQYQNQQQSSQQQSSLMNQSQINNNNNNNNITYNINNNKKNSNNNTYNHNNITYNHNHNNDNKNNKQLQKHQHSQILQPQLVSPKKVLILLQTNEFDKKGLMDMLFQSKQFKLHLYNTICLQFNNNKNRNQPYPKRPTEGFYGLST